MGPSTCKPDSRFRALAMMYHDVVRDRAWHTSGLEGADAGLYKLDLADFRRHLDAIPTDGRRLVAFLGGTIGNLRPGERSTMLAELASSMRSGDSLLLGTDLVKNRERLVAAYDDAAGVTAAFNKNLLARINSELGGTFDLDTFKQTEEPWRGNPESEQPQGVKHDLEKWNRSATH